MTTVQVWESWGNEFPELVYSGPDSDEAERQAVVAMGDMLTYVNDDSHQIWIEELDA